MRTYNTRFFVILTAVLAILLLFKNSITSILCQMGDNIDYHSPAFYIGYLLILFLTLGISISSCSKDYIPNKNVTFFASVILLIYVYLRFFETKNIYFVPINKLFNYADLIFLVGLVYALNLFLNFNKSKKINLEQPFFLQDILFANGDLTNEKILQKLISSLTCFKPEIAFSIGINAIWGYGKSSFLNKFKTEYPKKNPEAIVFWYRVWKNKGVNAIIENFFDELSNSLKPFSGELDSEFKGYVDSILQLPSTEVSKLMTLGRDALNGKETLEKHFLSINNAIAKIDRQIIVLLDDMDRLEQDEILNTLKLIRTLSDFNNLIFIVGYDRKYLIDTIEKPRENYLDKVFNVEINLLPFDESLIGQHLFKAIDKIYPKEATEVDSLGFNEAFKTLFDSGNKPFVVDIKTVLLTGNSCSNYELNYIDFLETIRDVKRFVNEFKFNQSFLDSVEDVVAKEYVLLKLLAYKYRYVQDLILNKLDAILMKGKIDWVNEKIQIGYGFANDVWIYGEESKKTLEHLLKREGCHRDFEVVNAVLCRLFAESSLDFYKSSQNSISKIYHTDLYLRNNIASGNITISEIQRAFENSELHLLVKRIGEDENKHEFTIQNELKYLVFRSEITTIEQFQDVVLSMNVFMSEGIHNDDERVLEILKDGLKEFYKNDRQAFVEMIKEVLIICDIGYLDQILSDINVNEKREEQKEKYTSGIVKYENNFFTPEEIEYLQLSKLKALIEQEYGVEIIIKGYHLLVEKITGSQQILRPFSANKILRNEIESKFLEYYETYLFTMISDRADRSEAEFRGYQPNDFLAQIFSTEEAHVDLLSKPNDISKLETLKKDGIKNLLAFLKCLKLEDAEQQDKLQKTIKTIEKYIDKDHKPLTKDEYDKIWNTDSEGYSIF